MRMARMRFSILGLMAVVAAASLGLWAWVAAMRAGRQAEAYRARAATLFVLEQAHRNRAAGIHNQVSVSEVGIELDRARDRDKDAVARAERTAEYLKRLVRYEDALADHYHGLVDKYTRAASRPWVGVPPDPPEPPRPRIDPPELTRSFEPFPRALDVGRKGP